MTPRFLTLDQVLELHALQVALFGGSAGTRDLGLLESALGNVEATYGGEYLHQTVFEMAAAYLYGSAAIIRSSTGTSARPLRPR